MECTRGSSSCPETPATQGPFTSPRRASVENLRILRHAALLAHPDGRAVISKQRWAYGAPLACWWGRFLSFLFEGAILDRSENRLVSGVPEGPLLLAEPTAPLLCEGWAQAPSRSSARPARRTSARTCSRKLSRSSRSWRPWRCCSCCCGSPRCSSSRAARADKTKAAHFVRRAAISAGKAAAGPQGGAGGAASDGTSFPEIQQRESCVFSERKLGVGGARRLGAAHPAGRVGADHIGQDGGQCRTVLYRATATCTPRLSPASAEPPAAPRTPLRPATRPSARSL